MRPSLRTSLAVSGGAVVLAVTGVSVAQAVTPAAPAPAPARHRSLTDAQRQQLRSTGHLSAVVHTKRFGDITALVQRGTVEAVSPTSITLRSKDGYQHSYVVVPRTKVREKGQPITMANLKTGERVMVVAVHTAKGDVARRISCVREADTA